jgi:hypothetical protein
MAVDAYIGNPREEYTKLESLAFVNGIDLMLIPVHMQFLSEELEQEDVAAVIYGDDVLEGDILAALEAFVRRDGGHVLFLYSFGWERQNKALQDLLGVSMADEWIKKSDDFLIYDSSLLPPWMEGLRVGFTDEYDRLGLRLYIVTPADGEKGYMRSEESGEERLMYLSYRLGNGRVTFWPCGYGWISSTQDRAYWGTPSDFMMDRSIDLFDNEQATLSMLNFLLGR